MTNITPKTKKSFILYTDQREVVKSLTDEQAGKLLKCFYNYQNGDDIELDEFLKIIFIPFRQTFERDNAKWEKIVDRNRSNIKKRYLPRATKTTSGKSGIPNPLDSVNDSDSVNDNVNDKNKEKLSLPEKENIQKKNKTYTSENLTLEQVAQKINQVFNLCFNKKFKGIDSFKSNLEYWLETYEPKEIATAIENSRYDQFFKDKLTPVLLFRRRNPRGENVDYISQLLNSKKEDSWTK